MLTIKGILEKTKIERMLLSLPRGDAEREREREREREKGRGKVKVKGRIEFSLLQHGMCN